MKSSGAKEASAGPPAKAAGSPGAPTRRESTPPPSMEDVQRRLKVLEEERDRLRAELSDARERFLRARADYENLAKRATKEAHDSVRSAKAALLLRLINVSENLERAARDVENGSGPPARGLRLVLDDLRKVLRDEGVREIETLNHPFNFQFHQAVDRIETSDRPEGTILEVVQRGYLLHGDVLRPALVKVAVPPKKAAERDTGAAAAPRGSPRAAANSEPI